MTLCFKPFVIEKAVQNQTQNSLSKVTHTEGSAVVLSAGHVDLRTPVLREGFKSKVLSRV